MDARPIKLTPEKLSELKCVEPPRAHHTVSVAPDIVFLSGHLAFHALSPGTSSLRPSFSISSSLPSSPSGVILSWLVSTHSEVPVLNDLSPKRME